MTDTRPTQTRAECATCGRDFAVGKSPNVRSHTRPHADEPWRDVGCEGAGQPPARTFPADAAIRAAAYREAAAELDADADRSTVRLIGEVLREAASLLRTRADEIAPAAAPTEETETR